ncbi:MAG: transcriptional repressor [Bacteroidaceae bacterium]|jgi:Fur family ferric uptake transcriptional regulator|nr:transcriptional repressor [Bacteroidaceae bacterium]MBQ5392943.1 transcriptional repressor [Bacteroidaceae bacterium]MBQ5912477.1 transcriptional repressor [Bacteroidaceae bacterium]
MEKSLHKNAEYEHILRHAGIRITSVRILVLKTIMEKMQGGAFSLQDIVEELVTAENSSVFRTLTLFAKEKILHPIDDGSSMQKYCLCTCGDSEHRHRHVHFTCTQCHRTICLEDIPVPIIQLPANYIQQDMDFIIKGICPKCSAKKI